MAITIAFPEVDVPGYSYLKKSVERFDVSFAFFFLWDVMISL